MRDGSHRPFPPRGASYAALSRAEMTLPFDPQNRSTPDSLRAMNRKRVLDSLRFQGAAARIELAERTGLSPATLTGIAGELLDAGLIQEAPDGLSTPGMKRGRPRTVLQVNPDAAYAVGIKISLHQAAVSLTNQMGDVLGTATVPIRANRVSPQAIAEICRQRVEEIIQTAGIDPKRILGVGVGVPGFVGHPSGEVRWSPLFAARDVPFRAIVEAEIGLRTVVDNDANMAALAEKWFGIGRRHSTFLVVTVEHGVGMGLVIDGVLYRGARGYGAEFGHTKVVAGGAPCRCGGFGCVEAYVSDYAIVRAAGMAGPDGAFDDPQLAHAAIEKLIEAADAGDERLAEIFRTAGTMLGTGISNLFSILDPSVVVLSGERTRSARVFFEAIRGAIQGNPLVDEHHGIDIEINPWGDDLWARGAAALVLEEIQV